MKKYIQLNRFLVTSISDGSLKTHENQEEADITQEELDKILSNEYTVYYKNGELVFLPRIEVEKPKKIKEQLDKIKKASSLNKKDLTDLLELLT